MSVGTIVGISTEVDRLFQREMLRALIKSGLMSLNDAQGICVSVAEQIRDRHSEEPHRSIADMLARQFEDVASHLAGNPSLPRDD